MYLGTLHIGVTPHPSVGLVSAPPPLNLCLAHSTALAKMSDIENQKPLPTPTSCYAWSPQSLPDFSELVTPRQMWALLGQILPVTSPLPVLVVWPVGLTHCPWPSPLVPASLDGFYSGRSLDGEPPPMRAREVVSSACSLSSQAMGSSRREGRERERSGTAGTKALSLPPAN